MDYFELLNQIYFHGNEVYPRGKETRELINPKLVVNGYNFFSNPEHRPLKKIRAYLMGELAWYYSGKLDANSIGKHSKFWLKLQNPDGTVNSNYGYLVFYKKNTHGYTAYDWAKTQLKNDPESRQAIILYNDRDYYYDDCLDYICTQLQHFFVRGGKLHNIVYLRSSDAIFGLTYDIPWWSLVQQQLAAELGYSPGKLEVNIGSSHLYQNKYKLVANMLNSECRLHQVSLVKPVPIGKGMKWYEDNLEDYIEISQIGTTNKWRER